jgi:hypothetical protein
LSQFLQDSFDAKEWYNFFGSRISDELNFFSISVLVQPNILAGPPLGTCGYGGISEYCGSNM